MEKGNWVDEKPWKGLIHCLCGGKAYVHGINGDFETGTPYHVTCLACNKTTKEYPTHQRACSAWRRLNLEYVMNGCERKEDEPD